MNKVILNQLDVNLYTSKQLSWRRETCITRIEIYASFETHFAFPLLHKKMNVIKAIQHYADKMINDVPGMKALLLDTETVNNKKIPPPSLFKIHFVNLFFLS